MAMCEYAWTSFNSNAKLFEYAPQDKTRFHPTQKPVALYEWILNRYAKAGDIIYVKKGNIEFMARKMSYEGKYKLSRSEFMNAKWHALRFNEWLDEYNKLSDSVSAISYERADMPKSLNKISCPTEELAAKRAELRQKMDVVINCAKESGGDLFEYILAAVTNEDVTYNTLKALKDIPCAPNTFYERRRKFYYLLAKEL